MIDCHVHITPNGKWFDTNINASLERLLEDLDRSPLTKALLLPVGEDEKELKAATDFIITLINHYPDKFLGFSGLYSGLDIKEVKENSLIGIKIHPRKNKLDPLDPELFPFYASVAEQGLPILFDSYCTPISDMPLEKIRPLVYRKLAEKFPTLKIVLAHCGMPFIWEAYLVLKWYKNIFADLSHILLYFKGTSLINDLAWVVRKIPHKFIYGSDFPEMGVQDYLYEFETFCQTYNLPSKEIMNNFHKIIS